MTGLVLNVVSFLKNSPMCELNFDTSMDTKDYFWAIFSQERFKIELKGLF